MFSTLLNATAPSSKVALHVSTNGLRGLRTTKKFTKGSTIVSLPSTRVIGHYSRKRIVKLWDYAFDSNIPYVKSAQTSMLIAHLLYLKFKAEGLSLPVNDIPSLQELLGIKPHTPKHIDKELHWQLPYVKLLPEFDIELLSSHEKFKVWFEFFTHLGVPRSHPMYKELMEFTLWACAVCASRSFCIPYGSETFLRKHSSTMFPVIDMCNHSDKPNAQVIFTQKGKLYELVAHKTLAEGTEIFIDYGTEAPQIISL